MDEIIKDLFRPVKKFTFSLFYMQYDVYRFLRYSTLWKTKRSEQLDYKVIKAYHSLEKSLSFKNRNESSGWSAATTLIELLKNKDITTVQRKSAIRVIEVYHANTNLGLKNNNVIESFLRSEKIKGLECDISGGTITLQSNSLLKGKLKDPEAFFNSRYSIRAFKKENISQDTIDRALKLASKTPSVCNRQSWGVFHLSDKKTISKALLIQNGNRGFSDEINDLLVIATDLSSFDSEIERFQNWIDGGIYGMSLVYAFHSLGIGSCFLNLSLSPNKDIRLRRLLNSPAEYSFITMIAIGYPEDEVNLCVSTRSSPNNYYFNVK